jgi:hypothetical protein
MIIPLSWSLCFTSISTCLITLIIILCASPPWSSFHVHALSLCDLVTTTPCHMLLHYVCCLYLTHSTWYNSISNLVLLITKTKLGLSVARHPGRAGAEGDRRWPWHTTSSNAGGPCRWGARIVPRGYYLCCSTAPGDRRYDAARWGEHTSELLLVSAGWCGVVAELLMSAEGPSHSTRLLLEGGTPTWRVG